MIANQTMILLRRPDAEVPQELYDIAAKWVEWQREYGDVGTCVIGAGFEFQYQGKAYFMPPNGPWQGSCSWEASKDTVQELLEAAGAVNILYKWGVMD